MASIHKEILIDARPEKVWDAIRDVGAVHARLATGFVTDTQLEGGARIVTFANGMVVRELIVDIDDESLRLAYAAVGGLTKHHNASMQVFAQGEGRTRLVWITDLLPNELAGKIRALVERGAEVMKKTLELASASRQTGPSKEPES
jgi:carbon monoxide dehydrogenase subunit G